MVLTPDEYFKEVEDARHKNEARAQTIADKKAAKVKKAHNKKLLKIWVSGTVKAVAQILPTLEAIGVFAPIMDAASGVVEIFSGKLQEKLMPSMGGIIDALLSEEMMTNLDNIATSFATVLDPLLDTIATVITVSPVGATIGAALGTLIGSFVGNATMGAVIGTAFGSGIGYAIETAPIGGTIGTIIGTAIGGVIGGPFGALIAAPIGAALGVLIENISTNIGDVVTRGLTYEKVPGTQLDIIKLMGLFQKSGSAVTFREWYWDVFIPSLGGGGTGGFGTGTGPGEFQGRYGLQEFHSGISYVPQTATYSLEKGERVVSAAENFGGESGGGDIHITIEGNLVGQNAMRELMEEIEYKKSIGRF